jgi:hypothetical protein
MKKLASLFIGLIVVCNSYSQTEIDDGKALIEAYASPLATGLGAALNNGWYNTAKPHKLGGFDVTLIANLVIIPNTAKSFNISDYGGTTFMGGNTSTILGNESGSEAIYLNPNTPEGLKVDMPDGLNIPIIPLPILQAGVGLIKGTELTVRYIPNTKIKHITTGLYGLGVKHDLLQWLPIVDKIPLDVSIQAGYTKLNSEVMLSTNQLQQLNSNEIAANLDVHATTVNLLVSKKLLMFTPYLGVGYNSTKTTFNIDGNYNIAGVAIDAAELTKMEFESNNNFKANVGFRFNITALALQANYTFSEYPVATVGVGVSVR